MSTTDQMKSFPWGEDPRGVMVPLSDYQAKEAEAWGMNLAADELADRLELVLAERNGLRVQLAAARRDAEFWRGKVQAAQGEADKFRGWYEQMRRERDSAADAVERGAADRGIAWRIKWAWLLDRKIGQLARAAHRIAELEQQVARHVAANEAALEANEVHDLLTANRELAEDFKREGVDPDEERMRADLCEQGEA